MTTFDHRRKFGRTPNLFSDRDGIRGNVDGLGVDVFAKDARRGKVETLWHQITAHLSRSFKGLLSRCGSIVRELGLFSLFDVES